MSIIFYILFFVFGAIIGSFLNVVVYRWQFNKKVRSGRSRCPHCEHILKIGDLFPVSSFIFLRGRCRYCREKISWHYPLVELLTASLFIFAFWYQGGPAILNQPIVVLNLFLHFFLISISVIIFTADWLFFSVFSSIIYIGAGFFFLFKLGLALLTPDLFFHFLLNSFWAVLIGGGFFALQYFVSRGRWVGDGDMWIGGFMGIVLGFPKIIPALLVAYLLGAVFSVFLLLINRKSWQSSLPMGVFLIPAMLIILYYGDFLLNWYFGTFL